jgi:hypothetical protein
MLNHLFLLLLIIVLSDRKIKITIEMVVGQFECQEKTILPYSGWHHVTPVPY